MAAVNVPQPLPEKDEQTGLSGFYYDQGDRGNQGDVVAGARTVEWFKSKELSEFLVKNLNSLELVTTSDDKGSTVAGANRPWFELSIQRDGMENLRWMSHENRFKTEEYEYHKGRILTGQSEIIKNLKAGDRIQVHAAADHQGSENRYHKGLLIFGIDVKNNVQPVDDSKLRELLEAPKDPNAASTFEDLGNSTADQVEGKIRGNGGNPIVSWLRWESADRIVTLSDVAKSKKKNILLVFDADDLLASTKTHRRLSWGQTVENIWDVLEQTCQTIGGQAPNKYFHLLVQIGFEGAIYKGFQAQATKAHLIYEPTSAEGDFLRSYSDTDMKKYGIKREELKEELMAAWMRGLGSSLKEESAKSIANLDILQIRDALMTGIRCSRHLAANKYPIVRPIPADKPKKMETDSEPVLVSVELDLIVHRKAAHQTSFKKPLVLDSLPCTPQKAAHDTLTRGFESVLPYMPSARFGNLVTADRGEVDGFRKIANTVHEWYLSDDNSKPLYIAVFGQPGSGKSFGVKEVINSILEADSKSAKVDEFNLSQFGKIEDLHDAFGAIQVSDKQSKKVPVVFFDEFDTTFEGEELGWLAYFLKIIKHGKYQDGDVSKPVKRGIYVFIGGTHTTYDDFFKPVLGGTQASEAAIEASAFEEHLKSSFFYKGSVPTVKVMNVDISKMTKHSELITAFNDIKKEIKAEILPLVIFKNFDSYYEQETLGWLKYFLAPMQDGVFYDKGTKVELGRAIFVFEQGTHHFNGFPAKNIDYRDFPGAKLPDFVSRLRGCVGNKIGLSSLNNVLTWYLKQEKPNKPLSIGSFRACETNLSKRLRFLNTFRSKFKGYVNILGPSSLGGGDEKYFVIRRAMLLRSMLQRNFGFGEGQFIDMDHGVLKALLFTPSVLHGARSLESILSMSRIKEGVKIAKEDLCTEDQRMLHVKDEGFQRLLNSTGVDSGTQATEEDMRRYAWIERKSGRGYKPRTVVPATPAAGSGTA